MNWAEVPPFFPFLNILLLDSLTSTQEIDLTHLTPLELLIAERAAGLCSKRNGYWNVLSVRAAQGEKLSSAAEFGALFAFEKQSH